MSRARVTNSFTGSTPRRAEHLTPMGHATRAVDCKLVDGALDSWREPRQVHVLDEGVLSAYQAFNCCWLQSTKCASWAEGSVEQRHVFATQYNDFDFPVRIVLDAMCEPTVLRLGLPCPIDEIVVSCDTTYNKGSFPRQYLIQWRDRFGNSSAPGKPSNVAITDDGAALQISGWQIPAGGWDIQQIAIYRSVSGYESATQIEENKMDAAWMLVDVIPATQTSYVDRKFNADLIDALQEDEVKPPPADLRGITWIRSMNCLAGFSGRHLYFSENNRYHNWAYSLTLDDTVRAIVESNSKIYVATDGAPYCVEGASDCDNAGCRQATRMPESLPLVGGGHRSMAAVPSGAVYPSHSGLVFMRGNQAPVFLTASHYAASDWQALHPDTMRAVYHGGRLYAFFRKGAFCLAMKDGASVAGDTEHHTELSLRPDEVFTSRLGRLFLRFDNLVKEWDRGSKKLPHSYESGEGIAGVPFNFGALQVIMEPGVERVQFYVDDELALDETIQTNEHFPLPLWATGQHFRWVLSGTARVKMIGIAPSTKEL
jgi:hypothetical protein